MESTATQISTCEQDERYPYDVFEVGDQVHQNWYSDVTPATVVEVKRNGREVTIQADNYELAEGEKPNIIAGGFAGHCTNQRGLKYNITRNEKGRLTTFTLRKWRGRYCWTAKDGRPDGCQRIAKGWIAYYDYNF